MTVAVCLKCGAMKHGALTSCPHCRHTPDDPEDQVKHVIVSDHYFTQADLQGISARVRQGLPLQFDPEQVAELMEEVKDVKVDRRRIRRLVVCFLAGFLLVIGALGYLLLRLLGK